MRHTGTVGGFTDADWGARGARPRRRGRGNGSADGVEQYVVQVALAPAATVHQETVDRAREHLVAQIEHWTTAHGYAVTGVTWDTQPPASPDDRTVLRAIAAVSPRMDGEWPAIRQAIAEDLADREAARDGSAAVSDRLDALAAAADVWGDRALRGR